MDIFEREYPQKTNWKREATGIASWIGLNLVDLVMTIVTMVAMDGRLVEGNPIAALIGGVNIAGLVGYKIALTFVAIVLLSRMQKIHLLRWLNIGMAAVVSWNLALFCVF